MRILIEDLSGKVELYDDTLIDAIVKECRYDIVRLIRPGEGLLSLVPRKYKNSESVIKRSIKVIEGLVNYAIIVFDIIRYKADVLHMQWLPFMDVNAWEIPILKLIRHISPKTKLVLTIHNVYPHNMCDTAKSAYNERFRKSCCMIDEFIVHTEISKHDVISEFGLNPDKVNVCCHGVFSPKDVTVKTTYREDGKLHILQFGSQSSYKGTDLLVNAICGMDKPLQKMIETHIVGGISEKYLAELKAIDNDDVICWKPYFLDNDELYKEINNSDLIILPYRTISQSGVLLLSIFFEKLIICSDLPSFMETMRGGEDNCLDEFFFFKNDNAESLRELITRYVNKEIDEVKIKERIIRLKALYSWESAARATLRVYHKSI